MVNISFKNLSTKEKIIAFVGSFFVALVAYWFIFLGWEDAGGGTKFIFFVIGYLTALGTIISDLNKPNSKFRAMIKKKQ